ncbi:APC family permease [Enterococcus xiangfangensis]|uniref:Amino acid permease n=1 Tax=Enterococcus xiangfangensis TaxID=1296537 RepID=A0ABU3FB33_9ENTE|nr:amino acid permease [Enterococcus xiangfangensis]MBM7712365.1 APA family basic amino acid/polyamine antiporter [Enterococcus xiangfangensis]MDT2759869.1 amino acid permease [Enterococcus xiangfangensis]NBK08957.1 amino acid permease [Enterococcus asini]
MSDNQQDVVGSHEGELKRTMTFFPALSTVMGTVIGAGVFFKAASVATVTGSTSLHMLSWFLGGLISVCAGLTGAELAAAIPETGGMLRYIERAYGEFWSFLLGWAQVIIYFPANVAALAIIFATQFINLFGMSQSLLVPIAIIAATSIMLINFLGSKAGGMFQSITLVCKLVPLALIVIFGLLRQGDVTVSLFPVEAGAHVGGFAPALGAGLLATMFAYDGWIHVGNIAGELKNPARDLPRAIAGGILGIMVVYLLVQFAFLRTMDISVLAGNENAAMEVAKTIFGGIGGRLVTIGILISVYGTINGYTMTGMRLPYTMGLEKQLPFSDKLVKLNKNQVPYVAGILELVIAIVLMMAGGFDVLTDMLIFVIWIFYTLVFIAVIKLRKTEPDLVRPYKVPLYPIIPIIAIIGGVFILVMTLVNQFQLAMVGILITALGIPFYLYMKRKYK